MHLVSFAVILILLHSISVARAKKIANEIENLYSGMLTAPFFLGRNVVCHVSKIHWFTFELCVMKVHFDGAAVAKSRIRLILLRIERFYKPWLHDRYRSLRHNAKSHPVMLSRETGFTLVSLKALTRKKRCPFRGKPETERHIETKRDNITD